MQAQPFNNRAYERAIGAPFNRAVSDEGDPNARRFFYVRLMQVSIQHTYYNQSNDECPDFTITPTQASIALMRSLGLLFKREATGFSILYDQSQKENLLQYLKRQAIRQNEVWTRLSFVLSLNDPYFVNFTDIPFNLDPSQQNFYFTNQQAHTARGSGIILNRDDYVTGQELLDVSPIQYPVTVSTDVNKVLVQDISGEVVMCQPRCPPPPTQNVPRLMNCDDQVTGQADDVRCRETIYLDFSSLPEDKYKIVQIFYDEEIVSEREVLYTTSTPLPFCFIDLLFTDPTGNNSTLYPVRDLSSKGEVKSVQYQLKFQTRSIFWAYFIVPQPQRGTFENLRIESVEPSAARKINFAGPCCVYLANGAKAYRFISERVIPLLQKPEYGFQLLGRTNLMQHDGVIVDRLPVASRQQLLQDEATVLLDVDRSLCPQGNDKSCRKLVRRLGKCLCAGSSFAQGLANLKQLYAKPHGSQLRELRLRCLNLYSDTYVYV
jgi:hypothetical protein